MKRADVIAWLRRDLAGRDCVTTCDACGAPLFEDDDYISDDDGESSCWPAGGTPKAGKGKPCYSYRVTPEDAEAKPRPEAVPWPIIRDKILPGAEADRSAKASRVDRFITPEIEARLKRLNGKGGK